MPERQLSHQDRYRVALSTQRVCAILKLDPVQVLRRARLPADYLAHEGRGVSAQQCFDIWDAVVAEAKRPDLPLFLARTVARGPFNPAIFAFSCSPTVETGLRRLALFKPLIGPIILSVARTPDALTIGIASARADAPMPHSLSAFELASIIELARNFTAEPIVPLAVGLPGDAVDRDGLQAHFGVAVATAAQPALVLRPEDAARPLITANEDIWSELEPGLRRRMAEIGAAGPMSHRVESALLDMLPSGQCTVDAVCDRLHISKRSLHRYLKAEGESFQGLLDSVRSRLSLHYLSNSDISVQEISYLLAYRDPNSFYRAFRSWTGKTPMAARAEGQP